MKKALTGVILLALAVAPWMGCERESTSGPPTIQFGTDECVLCGMIITDARAAASARVRRDGKQIAIRFDDIGDLLDYQLTHPDEIFEQQYVADYGSGAWIELRLAHLVYAPDVQTPMGSGLIAYSNESDAQAASANHSAQRLILAQAIEIRRSALAARAPAPVARQN